MTTVIKTKNSTTTTTAPSSLAQGELAVNITDKKLWVGNAAGTPVQLINGGSDGVFTSVTDSGLTSGRVVYTSTGGLLASSANLLYSGTDLTVYGLTVGRGAGAVSTNTAVGASALQANTTETENTAVGYQAGYSNTASYNTFFGTKAGYGNTTGQTQVGIGRLALGGSSAGVTGSNNTAVGNFSLPVVTSGTDNSALGLQSLKSNTTGSYNTGIGRDALQANTTASNNTAVGYQAGYSNTTGAIDAFGYQALYSNSTGNYNAAFGYQALNANTTGTYNVAFGRAASQNTTTGGYNSSVGVQALTTNTTGANNTAFGAQALLSNTTASNNTAVGYQSAYSTTTGYNNIALGYQSLYSNTTGYENNATGVVTLYANTTGAFNSSYGNASLRNNTTGNYNTAMGVNALYSNTTASYNTAVGYQAGYTYTGGTNALNVFLGIQAGYTQASGTFNTYVGPQSGYYMTTGSKNTILGGYNGNQGGLNITTSSNYIVLSDGDGNPRGFFSNDGSWYNYCTGIDVDRPNVAGGTIKQTNGNTKVRVTGDGTAAFQFYSPTGGTSPVGSVVVGASSTSYATSSDYRLKENIAPMTGALDKVAKLKPVTYNWKSDNSVGEGFIAHELAEVVPNAVTGEKDAVREDGVPIYQGIDTSFLVATLTAAIQELNEKVTALEAQLNK